jgi:hypothetical protein
MKQALFRSHIADATGKLIRRFNDNRSKKGPYWDDVVQMMLDVCEDIEVGPDGTDQGELLGMLCEYLGTTVLERAMEDAAISRKPVIYEGKPAIFLKEFLFWMSQKHGIKPTSKSMAGLLRLHGAIYKTVNVVVEDKPTTRSIWLLPNPHEQYVG